MCAGSGSLGFPKPSTRETGVPGNMGGRVRRGGVWTLASILGYGARTVVCMYIHIPCAPVRVLFVSPSRAQGKQGCRGTWEDGLRGGAHGRWPACCAMAHLLRYACTYIFHVRRFGLSGFPQAEHKGNRGAGGTWEDGLGGGSMDAGQHPGLWRSCCGMYVHTYSMCADSGSLGFPKPSTRGNRGAEEHGRTRSDGGGQGCWPASCAMAHLQRYACTYIFHVRRFGLSPFP
jgi:hypothetical protein